VGGVVFRWGWLGSNEKPQRLIYLAGETHNYTGDRHSERHGRGLPFLFMKGSGMGQELASATGKGREESCIGTRTRSPGKTHEKIQVSRLGQNRKGRGLSPGIGNGGSGGSNWAVSEGQHAGGVRSRDSTAEGEKTREGGIATWKKNARAVGAAPEAQTAGQENMSFKKESFRDPRATDFSATGTRGNPESRSKGAKKREGEHKLAQVRFGREGFRGKTKQRGGGLCLFGEEGIQTRRSLGEKEKDEGRSRGRKEGNSCFKRGKGPPSLSTRGRPHREFSYKARSRSHNRGGKYSGRAGSRGTSRTRSN